MNKAYSRINWENYPSTDTPLNETNLNHMDLAVDTIDDRVITLDTTKANEADLLTCVASISFNATTGIMTITQKNGAVGTIDTGLSKLAINFDYDEDPTSPHYQQIIMEMKDGTYKYIDLSALITQYEFTNTSTIVWTLEQNGTIKANIPDGSITADKLQPNYLADIIVEVGKAQNAATNANADSLEAEGFAVGEQNGVPVTSESPYYHNNAKYYAEQSGGKSFAALTDVQFNNLQDGQVPVYNAQLKKWVNGESGMRIVQIPQPKTVQGQPKEYTYDGTQQTFEWDSIDSAHILLQNENQINAGNYNVIASLKGSGDLWTDMTNAPKSFAWTIAKAQGSFSLSANSASVDVNNPTATVNVTNVTGDGVISVASDDDNVATASISNGVITITGVGTGTATITVTMADGTNYLGTSATISVTATYTTQISLVVNGAKGDNIIVTDENGNQTDFSPIAFDSGATSKTVTAEIPSNGAEYKFASANIDHWDGTADKAEKVIKLNVPSAPIEILDDSNIGTDWTSTGYGASGLSNESFSIQNDVINLAAPSDNSHCRIIGTSNAFDLTSIDRIRVYANIASKTGDLGVRVYLLKTSERADISTGSFSPGLTSTLGEQTVDLDVSNFTGEYYLAFANGPSNNSTGIISKVELVDYDNADVMPNGDNMYWAGLSNNVADIAQSYTSSIYTLDAIPSANYGTNKVKIETTQIQHLMGFGTPSAIDLSPYSKIKVSYKGVRLASSVYGTLTVLSNKTIPAAEDAVAYALLTSANDSVAEIDVSALQGNYYITVNAPSARGIDINAIWLESLRSLPVGETENVTFTIEGAYEDKITIYDKYGEVVDYVDFATDATSKQVTLAIRTGGEKLKFVSSVAKGDNDKNYYEWFNVDSNTTSIVLIPSGVLFWFGNQIQPFTIAPTTSTSAYQSVAYPTNKIDLSGYSKIRLYIASGNSYCLVAFPSNAISPSTPSFSATITQGIRDTGWQEIDISSLTDEYFYLMARSGPTNYNCVATFDGQNISLYNSDSGYALVSAIQFIE